MADLEILKKLREETGAGVMDVKKALEESNDDINGAKKILLERGAVVAAKKSEREVDEGRVESYIHATGKIGALVEVLCETDFVARTEDFKNLTRELAMQVAGTDPQSLETLLSQEYIRDSSKSVQALVNEMIAKTGENIKITRFSRFQI